MDYAWKLPLALIRQTPEAIKSEASLASGEAVQLGRSLVHGFPQRLSRFEMRHALFRNGHGLAAARITSHAGRAVVHRKAAKAPDLDAVSAHQGVAHGIQDGLDREFCIAVGELTKAFGQLFNEV